MSSIAIDSTPGMLAALAAAGESNQPVSIHAATVHVLPGGARTNKKQCFVCNTDGHIGANCRFSKADEEQLYKPTFCGNEEAARRCKKLQETGQDDMRRIAASAIINNAGIRAAAQLIGCDMPQPGAFANDVAQAEAARAQQAATTDTVVIEGTPEAMPDTQAEAAAPAGVGIVPGGIVPPAPGSPPATQTVRVGAPTPEQTPTLGVSIGSVPPPPPPPARTIFYPTPHGAPIIATPPTQRGPMPELAQQSQVTVPNTVDINAAEAEIAAYERHLEAKRRMLQLTKEFKANMANAAAML
jgi:hypothetical protein